MSFYQKYYQLLLHGKFPMKEKKLLVVGPPDSGKTSWFAPFQGMLNNIDLVFGSEKITAITCLKLLSYRNQSFYLQCISIVWFLYFRSFS